MSWRRGLLLGTLALAVVAATVWLNRQELMRWRSGLPAFTHSAGEAFDVMVAMADDVRLFTTVQLPAGDGPFPTILIRSPYAQVGLILRETLCGRFVRYGYACVLQDTRGQGQSEGGWDPGTNSEISDGRDTLNWLIKQDFQDGNIAMVGSSYLASVQYAALAAGAPPELKTIIPAMYTTDNRTVTYQDGMFRHETYTAWGSMMRGSNSSIVSAGDEYQQALRYRPHNEVDTAVFGMPMPWYQEMIAAASPLDDYWHRPATIAIREVPAGITIPVLMIGGWYDVFFGPQFEDWQRLATKADSRYIIGPYTHSGTTGELPAPDTDGGRFQWEQMLPWLEHHLKGEPLTLPTGLRIYVMGERAWEERAQWPQITVKKRLHLTNLAESNACEGGALGDAPHEGEVSIVYDPDNPVPTRGGAGMLAYNLPGFDGAPPANVEQSGLCERDDVLTFQSGVLEEDLLIEGAIGVTLDVSSSAPDTAFTAKLIEVFPDGRSYNIRDSITRLAFRNGAEVPQEYQPGERVEVALTFWPIAWRVQAGSRLRLDVSSSDFPKFHAHTNRAGPWAAQSGADLATQTLYGGEVTLPLGR